MADQFCTLLRSEVAAFTADAGSCGPADVAIDILFVSESCLAALNSPHSVAIRDDVAAKVEACNGSLLVAIRTTLTPETAAQIASQLASKLDDLGISDASKDIRTRPSPQQEALPVVVRSQTCLLTQVYAETGSWSFLRRTQQRLTGVTRPTPWRAQLESRQPPPAGTAPATSDSTSPSEQEGRADVRVHSVGNEPADRRDQVSVRVAVLSLLFLIGGPLSWAILSGAGLTDNLSASETTATEPVASGQNEASPSKTSAVRSTNGSAGRSDQAASPEKTEFRDRSTPVVEASTEQDAQPLVAIDGTISLADEAVEARLQRDATYLASDDLEGRGVRTRGLELAASFLAEQFATAGLKTEHFNGTPFQEFELFSIGGDSPVQQLTFHASDQQSRQLKPDHDFASLVLSRNTQLDAPVVFAGYGISAPEVGYDDYRGLDVSGKAVVVLRHAPPLFDSIADDLAKHSYVRTKVANASARGAAAVLLCTDLPTVSQRSVGTGVGGERLLRVELRLDDGVRPVPVVHCRRETLTSLMMELCEFDLDATETTIRQSGKADSRELGGLSLTGQVAQLRRGRTLKNVLATLEPASPANEETVVVGAHYDHLGRGGWGSLTVGANHEIHNGADDNASGTAVLLEVARQLAADKTALQRRILFIAFSAEELGLIGSRKYVEQPLIPMDQTIAMLNLDMVGRLRNDRLTVYGTGSSRQWSAMLDLATAGRNLTLVRKPSGYGPSDHASFYEAGVPVLHFFTGFHPQYHRPEDDIEHLNVAGMRRIAALTVDLVKQLAQAEERPPRTLAGDPAGLLGTSVSFDTLLTSPTRSSRPVLGVVPANRGSNREGVLVERTVNQSVADLYGFRSGDIIVRIGDDRVNSVDELVTRVGKLAHGDQLPIELVRNGIRLEIQVQF
ncbi:MAG: M20/M25/M40 family metallo-hydrolase [Planctomycetota bacterium]